MFNDFEIFPDEISKEKNMEEIVNFLIFSIPKFSASKLSIDGKLKKNRNFFYFVKEEKEEIVRFIQKIIWKLCDSYNITFISFNYDGLIEAFLDCDLTANQRRETPIFRYFPEISHGVPLAMPEHIRFKNGHFLLKIVEILMK